MWAKTKSTSAFTIVELLIVIVVIAILAAITIVAFNGVQDRARASAAASSSTQAAKKIKIWQVDNEGSSPDCPKFYELVTGTTSGAPAVPTPPAVCIFTSKDTAYQYTPSTSVAGGYCVTTTVATRSYKVTESSSAQDGSCPGHGQGGVAAVGNLVTNPSFRSNTTGWSGLGATISRVTSPWSADSNGALQVTATGQDSFAQTSVPVQAGQTYTILGTINLQAAQTGSFQGTGQQRNIFPAFHDAGGVYISTGTGGSSTPPSNAIGTYSQRLVTTAPANATQLRLRFYNGATAGNTVYWDKIMVVPGTYSGAYADGETVGWGWNGAADEATSSGPPQ